MIDLMMIYFLLLISYTKISLKTGILFYIVLNFNYYLTLIKVEEKGKKASRKRDALSRLRLL